MSIENVLRTLDTEEPGYMVWLNQEELGALIEYMMEHDIPFEDYVPIRHGQLISVIRKVNKPVITVGHGLCINGPLKGKFIHSENDYLEVDTSAGETVLCVRTEPRSIPHSSATPGPKDFNITTYTKKSFPSGTYRWHVKR